MSDLAAVAAGDATRAASPGPPRRVGILVPPENPTVEPEMARVVGPEIVCHIARLPLTVGADLRGRLDGYRAGLRRTLEQFGELPLTAILIACTGAFYTLGPEEDRRLCADLSDRHGIPVQTATRVILGVLRGLGSERLVVVSPYPSWLTEAACAYWTAAGLDVRRTVEIAHGRPIYSIGAEDVRSSLDVVARAAADDEVILVSGTGVPTVSAIAALRDEVSPTILSSNQCGGLWLTDPQRLDLGGRP